MTSRMLKEKVFQFDSMNHIGELKIDGLDVDRVWKIIRYLPKDLQAKIIRVETLRFIELSTHKVLRPYDIKRFKTVRRVAQSCGYEVDA